MARKNRLIAAANLNLQEIEPLTQNQLLAFEADNNLVLHGVAGTGKSFISCYLGFDDILKNDKERIVLIRSAEYLLETLDFYLETKKKRPLYTKSLTKTFV